MSNLVVVPFDDNDYNGRTTGDSAMNPEIYFPYEEGMTVEDIRRQFILKVLDDDVDENGQPTEEMKKLGFNHVDEIIDEYGLDCTGGWVIEKRDLDIINSGAVDVGNDSALYLMIHTMKCQVENAAIKTIE